MSKEYFIYQHLDKKGTCIYVGRTTNMKARQTQHKCYSHHFSQVEEIIYTKVANKTTMIVYEQYYINKLNPFYNIQDKRGDDVSGLCGIKELTFKTYRKYTQPFMSCPDVVHSTPFYLCLPTITFPTPIICSRTQKGIWNNWECELIVNISLHGVMTREKY